MNGTIRKTILVMTLGLLRIHSLQGDCSVASFFGGKEECWGRSPQALKDALNPLVRAYSSAGEWTADLARDAYDKALEPAASFINDNALIPLANALKDLGNEIDKLLEPVKKVLRGISDMLKKAADEIDGLPSSIRTQIKDLDTMPDQLDTAARDVQKSIADILLQQKDLERQKTEIVAQNLKSKGLKELAELETTLLQALDELNQALQILATCTPMNNDVATNLKNSVDKIKAEAQELTTVRTILNQQCSAGILLSFLAALEKSKTDAIAGKNTIQENIHKLEDTIQNPDLGFPSLPARLRAVATILNP